MKRRKGKNSSFFNPSFFNNPSGQFVHLRKKEKEDMRGKREARGNLFGEIKCTSLKFVVFRLIFVLLARKPGFSEIVFPCYSSKHSPLRGVKGV